MKLVFAIVQDEDAGRLVSALMKDGFGVTKLATTGGFLRSGNTTLIIGLEDERLDTALDIIERICKTRNQVINPNLTSMDIAMGMSMANNLEITIGGATVFVVNVERFNKY
ncbi:MAG TPA: cyclic-di-AMP receptor [Clostridia bacterium]|nr:cyclic-di-AMP receptor [Clostridia bacterium]